jgi:hypothetical protein
MLFALTGCVAKYTGGGFLASAEPSGTANFGFKADSCDAFEVQEGGVSTWYDIKGKFNYVDRNAGVRMNGDFIYFQESFYGVCKGFAKLSYRSTLPGESGTGFAIVCITDNGEGANAEESDTLWIYILDGPFGGYENGGDVQGNIQEHECK